MVHDNEGLGKILGSEKSSETGAGETPAPSC